MALATTEDVETALERPLQPSEGDRAEQLLAEVSAQIESLTGYRFAPGDYEVGRVVRNGRTRIPARVGTVTEVRALNRTTGEAAVIEGWTLRKSTLYGLGACYVEVDFTIDDDPPAEIVAMVARIVAGTVDRPKAEVQQVMAGPFQASFSGSDGTIRLSKSDRLILRKYGGVKAAMVLL